MKLISYRHEGREAYGVVKDGGIVDMSARMDHSSLKLAIAGLSINEMEKLAAGADADVSLDDIEYMFPITTPEKIFRIGRNYRAYHEVLEDGGPKWPSIFPRFASGFAPHGEAIYRPAVSEQLDYEGEIGVIIGKPGRHIPEENALDYVAGYTIINEGSVRDWQTKGTQNCPGKNFHRSGCRTIYGVILSQAVLFFDSDGNVPFLPQHFPGQMLLASIYHRVLPNNTSELRIVYGS